MTAAARSTGATAVLRHKGFVLPPDHGLFGNCHASTLVRLSNGTFLVAYFGGLREGEGDVAIWLSRGDGSVWQPPRRLMAEEGLAHWNPVLFVDGDAVHLFYKVGPTVHDWITRWSTSMDGGLTWSAPVPLVPGDGTPRGPVKNKLVRLSSGEWLAPGSVETPEVWDAFADLSADGGMSWTRYDVPFDHRPPMAGQGTEVWSGLAAAALWETDPATVFKWDGVIQPTAWEDEAGVHMLMRSTRGSVYRTDSTDLGRTWSVAYATPLPNNNSGIDLVRTARGILALVCNPVAGNWGRRYPISLALSSDGGETWRTELDFETEEGEFSYPAVIEVDGILHVTYTWNRKTIVHAVVELLNC
ncbi:conserved hypothetical protein [uncultured Pleomorphomonas sp.]|uniref:Sialidase domain-containing protein n=1 Tax=uncultured Pleomorphomonas sp. TaxID=442121 RepID=A0A212LG38_9HYPH|nr:exo-alpha-sialidase [uncultured Pleomorphomonas sp.]SCM76521.1 conserved hypothetical protein [uncultured Pleomorphomonas sp.]